MNEAAIHPVVFLIVSLCGIFFILRSEELEKIEESARTAWLAVEWSLAQIGLVLCVIMWLVSLSMCIGEILT